jgi:hypothetical protein
MSQELDRALAIQLDDGRVVVATPKPEDQERLAKLDKDIVFLTAAGDYDTAGHGYGDLLELDVEGHAITLRLPSPADAEAVRRAVAVGAVTATIVAAGAIAALQGNRAAPVMPEAAAPPAAVERVVPAPQPRADFMERRDQALDPLMTEQMPVGASQTDSSTAADSADTPNRGTHGGGRGELELP